MNLTPPLRRPMLGIALPILISNSLAAIAWPMQSLAATPTQIKLSTEQVIALAIRVDQPEPVKQMPIGNLPGRIVVPPDSQRVATVPFASVVVGLHVQDGERIRAGDPLATFRSREAGQASADATRLEGAANVARMTAARERSLVDEGIAAARRATESEAEASAAIAAANAAKSAIRGMRFSNNRGDEFSLIAPVSGIVEERGLHVADEISANAVAFVVVTDTQRWVEAQLPERLRDSVRVGDTATLNITAARSDTVNGKIVAVGQTIDPQTRSALLRAAFAADARLVTGRTVEIIIHTAAPPSSFRVPTVAVVRHADRDVLFVRTPEGFDIVPVTTAARVDGYSTVTGNLPSNAQVAVTGTSALKAVAHQE